MKARSFAHLLDAAEASDWHKYVKEKLSSEGGWLNMSDFERRVGELEAKRQPQSGKPCWPSCVSMASR